MNNVNEFIHINELLDIYFDLLSHSQKDILSLYYRYNLSISEIAQQKNISRSAVNDALKKGVNTLNKLEEELHINHKNYCVNKLVKEIKKDTKNKHLIEQFLKEYK